MVGAPRHRQRARHPLGCVRDGDPHAHPSMPRSGRQAQTLGLIDELGNLEDAIEGAKNLAGLSDALVVRYRAFNTLRDLLQANLERNLQPVDPLGLRAVVQPQAPRLEYRFVP